eukprot:1540025-Pleurochrysis_carterae.AAC.1
MAVPPGGAFEFVSITFPRDSRLYLERVSAAVREEAMVGAARLGLTEYEAYGVESRIEVAGSGAGRHEAHVQHRAS